MMILSNLCEYNFFFTIFSFLYSLFDSNFGKFKFLFSDVDEIVRLSQACESKPNSSGYVAVL